MSNANRSTIVGGYVLIDGNDADGEGYQIANMLTGCYTNATYGTFGEAMQAAKELARGLYARFN
jgi:hypothetical protein